MSSCANARRARLTAAVAARASIGLKRRPDAVGSAASEPAIASSTTAQSSALRAIGPILSSVHESAIAPCRLTDRTSDAGRSRRSRPTVCRSNRGLGTERVRDETCPDRGPGSTRRSTGPAFDVPGVAAWTLERRARVAVAATAGELHHRELRGEHGARALQLRPRSRRDRRPDRDTAARPRSGCALRREQVLGAVRDTEQRSPLATLQCRIRALRFSERALARDGRDGVVARTDARETVAGLFGELHRGDHALAQCVLQLRDGGEAVIAQGR